MQRTTRSVSGTPRPSRPQTPQTPRSGARDVDMSMDGPGRDETDDSDPTYTHFQHRGEFMALLGEFLEGAGARGQLAGEGGEGVEEQREEGGGEEVEGDVKLVSKMGDILDYYLPMPGLLDPALGDIVPPLMAVLATQLPKLLPSDGPEGSSGNSHIATTGAMPNAKRLALVGRLLNWIVKVRGWKAVVPYFPSEIPHLSTLIALLSRPRPPSQGLQHPVIAGQDAWELRAVLLLWLALLLSVPFSLTALSDTTTPTGLDIPSHARLFSAPTPDIAVRVTLLSLPLLHRPGKEGGYAALVLARLFARDDAVQGLSGFFTWAAAELREGERESEANFVASLLSFLALLPRMAAPVHLETQRAFLDRDLIPHLAGSSTAASSGLIRKLAVKARGRWWLARLGRGFHDDPDAELPDGIEEELDDLMSGLGDRDTIVRYSSAKYLGRIAALLPAELSDQIVMATVGLFAGTDDEPVVETAFGTVIDPGGNAAGAGGAMGLGGLEATRGEARWHGVCLAVAELARRGLLNEEAVAESIPWVIKALTFDLRRASHSIGSNVRDAASYVLWSLARASSPTQLAPAAPRIATSLVCAALFDREVGVRRAASAAFQEGVGRHGLYPAGIDVLAKTDFYSVSVRRKAFNVAAPSVAVHPIYASVMREHLHNITLRHWDANMRTAGAGALRALLDIHHPVGEGSKSERAPEAEVAGTAGDMSGTLADSIAREVRQLASFDSGSAHGALVALTQLASLTDEAGKNSLLSALPSVRAAALITTDAPLIIQAGCALISATVTSSSNLAPVQRFVDAAMRSPHAHVHEALADAFGSITRTRPGDAPDMVTKLVADTRGARQAQRQAAALCLGHVVYGATEAREAVGALLALLEPGAKIDVETRRNAVRSLADILVQRRERTTPILDTATTQRVVEALLAALEDYTTDQRGDVGSWVRAAGVNALARVICSVAESAGATNTASVAVEDSERLNATGGANDSSSPNRPSSTPSQPVSWADRMDDDDDPLFPVTPAQPPHPTQYIPQTLFTAAVAGIAKQAFEKLQPVRAASTRAWGAMLDAGAGEVWRWEGAGVMVAELAVGVEGTNGGGGGAAPSGSLPTLTKSTDSDIEKPESTPTQMRAPEEWFTTGLELLRTEYHYAVVSGLVQTTGGGVHSASDRACRPLTTWLASLAPGDEALTTVLDDMVQLLASSIAQNRIAIPVLMTLGRLYDAGVATFASSPAADAADAADSTSTSTPQAYARALALASRGVTQLKSIDRLGAAMRVVVASLCLPFADVRRKAAVALKPFLAHRFPRIRAMTSEALYTALVANTDIEPELEEVLLETSWTGEEGVAAAEVVVGLVGEMVG